MVDQLNEKTDFNSGITLVRPIDSSHPSINQQNGLNTAITRGINEQKQSVSNIRIINSVNREILIYSEYDKFLKCAEFANYNGFRLRKRDRNIDHNVRLEDTPASSFPAKLTQFLFHRFQHFNGDSSKGLFIIPCELIDYNGDKLQEFVNPTWTYWQLPADFIAWLNSSNTFCSTLVDRIVTGYPKNESKNWKKN
ncbi:hypothetical protein [Providencia hangzhouensis]|uniref:hypothetical protein n=1 Tax=Providencia hangzhouensis TaxID=3031799 RepID=UPI0034DD407E